MIFFKTTVYTFFILMLFAACAKHADIPEPRDTEPRDGEKSTLRLTLNLGESDAGTNATPGSTAIPMTSWNTIKKLQVFLCSKPDNKVVYSCDVTRDIGKGTIVLTGLPTGSYTLLILGNAMGTGVAMEGLNLITSIDGSGTNTLWDDKNVLGRNAETDLLMMHSLRYSYSSVPAGPWSYYVPSLSGLKCYNPFPDIFKGIADLTLSSDKDEVVSLPFKRIMSLMRLRFDMRKYSALGDFLHPIAPTNLLGCVFVFRVPKDINMITGVNPMKLTGKAAMSPDSLLLREDPVAGCYVPNKIIDAAHEAYVDVLVPPNNTGDSVEDDNRYFIVLAQTTRGGHILANGQKTPGNFAAGVDVVYWSAMINDPFKANEIREVNLVLVTGGSLEFPEPTNPVTMSVTTSKSIPWRVVDIPL